MDFSWLVDLLYFVLVLGIVVFSHELGHFIYAKRSGIYVYEFALGMGPKLYGFKRKNDETQYSIRLIPIGGYVKMAGEEIEEDKNIPNEKRFQMKPWESRFITVVAGALFNFILAILIFFVIALFRGSPELKPYLAGVVSDFPAEVAGMKAGDLIVKVNGHRVNTWDDVLLEFEIDKDKTSTFQIKRDGEIKEFTVKAKKVEEDGKTQYQYGFNINPETKYGVFQAIQYAFTNFAYNINAMYRVILMLITGVLSPNNLAGPVGIYNLVGTTAQTGLENVFQLIAFISINVGFVNLIPFPAFDGGRALFLIIEKIRGKAVDPKVENIIHLVGMVILLALMLLITIKDIKTLF